MTDRRKKQAIRDIMRETGESYCQVLQRLSSYERDERSATRRVRVRVAAGDLVQVRNGQSKSIEVSVRRPARLEVES